MAETTTAASTTTAPRATTTVKKTAATKRSTAAKKGVATKSRAAASTAAKKPVAKARTAAKAEAVQVKTTAERVQDVAEKAVLVPIGAALIARDRVLEVVDTYGTRAGVDAEVKKFERRGAKARTQAERRARKTRTQIERELRTRRTRVEREVTKARKDAEKQLKALDKQVAPVREQVELVQARAENLVQSGITAGTGVVTLVTERVAAAA